MIVASFVLAAICGVSSDADIATLVSQLGSDRYVQRQEASQALEKRGREALPALRSARDSKDPEVRARASALVDKIENLLMVQPTVVRLNFKNAPLPDVVKAISDQSGITLSLIPENSPLWQSRRVTLSEANPQPFWKALDGLCREGQLQHNSTIQTGRGGPRGTVIQLFAGGNSTVPVPSSDSGPFRVNVLGIHYQRDLRFGQNTQVVPAAPGGAVFAGGRNRNVHEQFYVDLQILAEPRMVLTQNGALKITEAVDENGQSLLVPTNDDATIRNSGYFGYSSGMTSLQMQAHLNYPEKPGRTISRLRGSLPVMVSARKDDALVVNLEGAKGKSFRSEEVTLVVHDIQPDPNQQRTTIDISLSPNNPSNDVDGPANRFPGASMIAGMNAPQNQMEILDANDRPYPQWFPSSTRIDNDQARMTLMLMPADGVGPPAKIRYYEMARATTEVPFEFTNVPMP
jgi:hypothetical protein